MKPFKTQKFETETLDIEVEHGSTSPKELWDMKDELTAIVDNSKAVRDKLGDEKYDIVKTNVRKALANMYDCVDEWLPDSLVDDKNQYIRFNFVMLWAKIDEELKNHQELTEFEKQLAVAGTDELVKELDA